MCGAHPVKGTLYLAHAAGQSAFGFRVICTVNLLNVSIGIFLNSGTFYYVCTFKTHFSFGGKTEELLGRVFHKIFALYIYFSAERHCMRTLRRIFRIIFHLHRLYTVFSIVGNCYFYRVYDSHASCRHRVKVFPHSMFKQTDTV